MTKWTEHWSQQSVSSHAFTIVTITQGGTLFCPWRYIVNNKFVLKSAGGEFVSS